MGQKKLVRKAKRPSKRGMAWPRWTGFRGRTIWDWLQLLIIPFVLAVIGFYFTSAQEYAHQLELEARRAAEARKLEAQRAQNAALQTYLEGMRELLLDKNLRASTEDSEVRAVARAQTRSALGQLGPEGQGIAIQFLYEASLIKKEDPVVSLSDVRLRGADLSHLDLSGADLSGADLSSADLSSTDLSDAKLSEADLSGADLSVAIMSGVDLSNTDLRKANLRKANLSEANLLLADLSGADLSNTDLRKANLLLADLSGAKGVTKKLLEEQTTFLEDATMPNGQTYGD